MITVSAVAVSKLNFFNLEARTAILSDDLSQRLGIESYSKRLDKEAPRRGQELVRVITIDDDGLDTLNAFGWRGWPPGYENLEIMVEDVHKADGGYPRALFFDFLITGRARLAEDERLALDRFVKRVGEASGALESDFFRPGGSSWGGVAACHQDPLVMLACMVAWDATPVIFATTDAARRASGTAQEQLSRVAILSPVEVKRHQYQLARQRDGQIELYPAMALYAAHCLQLQAKGQQGCKVRAFEQAYAVAKALRAGEAPKGEQKPAQTMLSRWQKKPLATLWSTQLHPRQYEMLNNVSGGRVSPCASNQSASVFWVIREAFRKNAQDEDVRSCEYTVWMGYDRLLLSTGLTNDDYDFLLSDKLIVVGVRSYMSNDWIEAPLHGKVPGPFYHAMALDNLVEMGPRYRKASNSILGKSDLVTIPLGFILTAFLFYCSMSRTSVALHFSPQYEGMMAARVLVVWYATIFSIIVIFSTIWISITRPLWYDVSVNWVGVYSVVFGTLFAVLSFSTLRDLEGFFERREMVGVARFICRLREFLDPSHEDPIKEGEADAAQNTSV